MSHKNSIANIFVQLEKNKYADIHISDYSDQSDQENLNDKDERDVSNMTSQCLWKSSSRSSGKSLNSKKRRRSDFKPLERVKIFRKSFATESSIRRSAFSSVDTNLNVSEYPKITKSPWQRVKTAFSPLRVKSNGFSSMKEPEGQRLKCAQDIEIEYASSDEENKSMSVLEDQCIEDDIEIELSNSKQSQIHLTEACLTPNSKILKEGEPVKEELTELDHLLALIEKGVPSQSCNNGQSPKPKPLRCKKGGYLDLLFNALDSAKADRKYLAHDKKFDLSNGNIYEISEIFTQSGTNIVTLKKCDDGDSLAENRIFSVVPIDMIATLQEGQKIEVFFDPLNEPYLIDVGSNKVSKVYIQPNKLLPL